LRRHATPKWPKFPTSAHVPLDDTAAAYRNARPKMKSSATELTECIFVRYTFFMVKRDPLEACTGFDWDDGNLEKNWESHRVAFWECEQIFFNRPLVVRPDASHSKREPRFFALGATDGGRLLFAVLTIRGSLIRPISVRDVTRKEKRVYERFAQEDSDVS
jgi:hypothetical protein